MNLLSAASSPHLVETVGPVDTEESENREVNACSDTGASFQVEGRELLDAGPAVTRLGECDRVDGGRGLEQEREVKARK